MRGEGEGRRKERGVPTQDDDEVLVFQSDQVKLLRVENFVNSPEKKKRRDSEEASKAEARKRRGGGEEKEESRERGGRRAVTRF
jgi:hypothetical protein